MRKLTPLAFVLLIPALSAAPVLEIEFTLPAQVGHDTTTMNATWALVLYGANDAGDLSVDFPETEYTNFTERYLLGMNALVMDLDGRQVSSNSSASLGPFQAHASFAGGPASLYMEGPDLAVHVWDQAVGLD